MAITRNDIINKTFTRSYLGYDDEEVDSFLDEIMADIERNAMIINSLSEENAKLKTHINRMGEELTTSTVGRGELMRLRDENQKLQIRVDELSVAVEKARTLPDGQSLEEAQAKARELMDMAQRKSREIITSAQDDAARVVEKAQEEARSIAKTVQDREREIMDRAQKRAKSILDGAQSSINQK